MRCANKVGHSKLMPGKGWMQRAYLGMWDEFRCRVVAEAVAEAVADDETRARILLMSRSLAQYSTPRDFVICPLYPPGTSYDMASYYGSGYTYTTPAD
jgi:hypothetical protein